VRRVGRAGDDGRALWGCPLPFGGGAGKVLLSFVRVGACADELRLMGVTRVVKVADRGGPGGGWGSVARNTSRAAAPPRMERICSVP
jgi:hypothetical protein